MSEGAEVAPFTSKYCRMCALETKRGVWIFGDEGKRLQLSEKIRKTLAILVLEEDELPKRICTDCCSSLEDYSKYKDTVLDAQEKLASIAKRNEQQRQRQEGHVLENALGKVQEDKPPVAVTEMEMQVDSDDVQANEAVGVIGLVLPVNLETTSKKSQEYLLQCGICGEPGDSKDSVKSHHEECHGEGADTAKYPSPVYGCYFCPRVTENYNALRMHIYRHLKEGSFPCSSCDKSFPLKDQLERHWGSIHGKQSFPCKLCGKRFAVRSNLAAHVSSKHPPKAEPHPQTSNEVAEEVDVAEFNSSPLASSPSAPLSPEDGDAPVDSGESGPSGPGPVARKSTKSQSAAAAIVVAAADTNNEDGENSNTGWPKTNRNANMSTASTPGAVADPGFWKCSHCHKQFTTQRGYDLHLATHLGQRHTCDHCASVFTQKSSLAHHLASQHGSPNAEPFKCDLCPKTFTASRLYHRHKRRHAVPQVDSKCDLCGKTFRTLLHLKSHLQVHKGPRNFGCKECGKAFPNQHKLKIHENTHTGARTLHCPHCSYAARTQGPYYRHLKRHHGKESSSSSSSKCAEVSSSTGAATSSQPIPSEKSSSAELIAAAPSPMLEDLSTKSPQKLPSFSTAAAASSSSNTNTSSSSTHPSYSGATGAPATTTTSLPQDSSEMPHYSHLHTLQNVHWSSNYHGSSNATAAASLELVDCAANAIQHAFTEQQQQQHIPTSFHQHTNCYSAPYHPHHNHNNSTATHTSPSNAHSSAATIFVSAPSSSNGGSVFYASSPSRHGGAAHRLPMLNEPMELSYKLQLPANNEIQLALQTDPLELCVRHEFSQLMDLSSREGGGSGGGGGVIITSSNSSVNNSTLSCIGGMGNYQKELAERELVSFGDLSGAFRQPIDLISRTDESSNDLCSEGSLVDLSLRSTFSQDQSSFFRDLIDLSSRSDSFQDAGGGSGSVTLTKQNGNNGNGSHSQPQHSLQANSHHKGLSQHVIYSDTILFES